MIAVGSFDAYIVIVGLIVGLCFYWVAKFIVSLVTGS